MSCYPACALGSRVSQAMFHSVIRIYWPVLSLWNDCCTHQGMPVSFRSDLRCKRYEEGEEKVSGYSAQGLLEFDHVERQCYEGRQCIVAARRSRAWDTVC